MRKGIRNLFFGAFSVTALAVAFAATPMFSDTASLEADKWEFYFGSIDGPFCSGCCPGGLSLCCDVPADCSS